MRCSGSLSRHLVDKLHEKFVTMDPGFSSPISRSGYLFNKGQVKFLMRSASFKWRIGTNNTWGCTGQSSWTACGALLPLLSFSSSAHSGLVASFHMGVATFWELLLQLFTRRSPLLSPSSLSAARKSDINAAQRCPLKKSESLIRGHQFLSAILHQFINNNFCMIIAVICHF